MTELRQRLDGLGLSQYIDAFIAEGFDSWETLLDIQESDLEFLNVKLGHRRKLQRAIAEARGVAADRALPDHRKPSVDASYRSDDSAAEHKEGRRINQPASTSGAAGTKRKYRRHPKADENAPERPASAYVIFSNQVREELKGQDLSFTDIAKTVGERWQVLLPGAREVFERQAAAAKEKYYAELAEYKKTPLYAQYQEYLADFKAKHAAPRTEGKRTKMEPQASTSTRSSSQGDAQERSDAGRGSGQSMPDGYGPGLSRTDSSPTVGGVFPAPPYHLSSTSPATYGSNMHSPSGRDQYSPKSTSASASASAYPAYELPHHGRSTSLADRVSSHSPHVTQSSYRPSSSFSETDPAKHSLQSLASPRRTERPSTTLPPLLHADTAQSSDSGGNPAVPYQSSLLPVLDAPKADRMLPQPVPTQIGVTASPINQQSPTVLPPMTTNVHLGGQWPALLRATELARDADLQECDREDKPT